MNRLGRKSLVVSLAFILALTIGSAQDRLKTMPGYEQHQKMGTKAVGSIKMGTLTVSWKDGGKAFEYSKDGKRYRFDTESKASEELKEGQAATKDAPAKAPGKGRRRGGGETSGILPGQAPERGRQYTSSTAPDRKHKAVYKDRNLFMGDDKGENLTPITTDGSEKDRIKYGTASWVYGEELYQTTAMWWSPDSKKLAYYRFDESKVADFYLQMNQTKYMSTPDIEAYPKVGMPNPLVDLYIYDVESRKSTQVDVRDGKTFDDGVVGHYVYNISWAPGGKELLFNRTNRRQNVMELTAADPETGKCRVIVREEWKPSWTDNLPTRRFLKDNNRFLWISDRTGFKNFYLYDLSGKLHATVTKNAFDVSYPTGGSIVRIDEDQGYLYYTACDGENHMKFQLHRAKLDGSEDKRLTDPAFHHRVDVAPDGKHFIDIYETHNTPPSTRLVDAEGKVVTELAKSDPSKFEELGLKKVEMFTYKAADGQTELHGLLHFPSNFDSKKKYPLLVSIYGGPETNGARENFMYPSGTTEYGFLVANLDSRSASGKGKKVLDAIYEKLGTTEIDDLANGVKALWNRPYFDKTRVGIYGTSYGGYASAMCLLRYPDVFQAAVASSPVTDWRQYDSIYTERYMWIPKDNANGYKAGSAMTYARNLKGRLMLYYGTADNNVHPNNCMQLIQALQQAGKSFEVQVGPDRGHTAVNNQRMMEFFIENLVIKPQMEKSVTTTQQSE
jgi:dipeptidyl-peptidase-4